MPPLGPRPYCFITSLYLTCGARPHSPVRGAWEGARGAAGGRRVPTVSRMSMLAP